MLNVIIINITKKEGTMLDNKKNIVLRVDQDFHKQVKLHVTMNNTTLQDYIVGLIKKDMEQKENK